MREIKARRILLLACLAAALVAGCGREQTLSPTAPFVLSSVPANGATGVLVAQTITATFNEAMNAGTINSSTFTVTAPGGSFCDGHGHLFGHHSDVHAGHEFSRSHAVYRNDYDGSKRSWQETGWRPILYGPSRPERFPQSSPPIL